MKIAKFAYVPLLALVLSNSVSATVIRAPESYTINLRDALFVMKNTNRRDCVNETRTSNCNEKFFAKFAKSGLYEKSSNKLIWSIDWFAEEADIILLEDGIHLIKFSPLFELTGNAIQFFHNGGLRAGYKFSDLIDNVGVLSYVPSYWYNSKQMDEKQNLIIETVDGIKYTFDISSGRIRHIAYRDTPNNSIQVKFSDGSTKKLNYFRNCWNQYDKHSQTDIFQWRKMPFSKLKLIENLGESFVWKFTFTDGAVENIDLFYDGFLCADDDLGYTVPLNKTLIKEIRVSKSAPIDSGKGFRTMAQRMSWDKEHWRKTNMSMCTKAKFNNRSRVKDKLNLIIMLRYSPCNKKKYDRLAKELLAWINNQTVDDNIVLLAINLGEMFSEHNNEKQAIKLFEQLSVKLQKQPINQPYINQYLSESITRLVEKKRARQANWHSAILEQQVKKKSASVP